VTGFKLSGLLLAFVGISTFSVCCAESIPTTNHINIMNRWHELHPGDVATLQIQTNPKARCIIQVIDGDIENFDEMSMASKAATNILSGISQSLVETEVTYY
jgi:hypothetical protein